MAPSEAVQKIENLLISCTENGVQDHKSLLDSYKLLDRIITTKGIQRPVVVLSDGHSSRFDCNVLRYLQDNEMRLYISPPDTTGVTQMLDQVNQALHSQYREVKTDLFTPNSTVSREGFMTILSDVWPTWTNDKSLVRAAKRVGITKEGMSVHFMQQDQLETAAKCVKSPDKISTTEHVSIASPIGPRKKSAEYYEAKLAAAEEMIARLTKSTPSLEEVGLLTIKKVTPKEKSTSVRVTQVHGSMEGKNVLALATKIKEDKEVKEKSRKEALQKKNMQKELFIKCKDKCNCEMEVCNALLLKQCPVCHNVQKSRCGKASCRDENGDKPLMLIPAAATAGTAARSRRNLSSRLREVVTDESSDEEDSEDFSDLDDSEYSGSDVENESMIIDGNLANAVGAMQKTEAWLNLPTKEGDLVNRWFALVYAGKRKKKTLFIAKLLNRFLEDADGPADEFLMRCLKPKVDSGDILEDTPKHLVPDDGRFKLWQFIAGPLEVIPKGSSKFMVPQYPNILSNFRLLEKEKHF